jgi:ABC-type Na+ transport system ATPase subunit NatA
VIEVRGLTKRYGDVLAIDDLSFDVQPGKPTTMRMVLGLDRPTSRQALVDGRSFPALAEPCRRSAAGACRGSTSSCSPGVPDRARDRPPCGPSHFAG